MTKHRYELATDAICVACNKTYSKGDVVLGDRKNMYCFCGAVLCVRATRERKDFILRDTATDDEKQTHQVSVFKDFVQVRPLSKNHTVLVDNPDPTDEISSKYETGIYIADHLTILIKGKKKDKLELLIESDEFPTKLVIDNSEKTLEVEYVKGEEEQ